MPQGFSKRFESEDTLVEKILKRGLSVSSEDELRRIIRITGYYRFTGYLYPFRKQGSDDYEKGTTLESIWRLYSFDRRLRLIAMDALARIEVAIRAKIMEAHSLHFGGDPFAYCDQSAMPGLKTKQFQPYLDSLDKAVRQARSAKDPAVLHHFAQYGESRVPVWVLFENLSFGDVAICYDGLPPPVQQVVANSFGIWPGPFKGWMKVLRRVRNICAHQGRLWNRKIDARLSYSFSQDKSLADLYACVSIQSSLPYTTVFTALSLCAWLIRVIRPESQWTSRVKELLADYPEVPLAAMGFPAPRPGAPAGGCAGGYDWQTLALWK